MSWLSVGRAAAIVVPFVGVAALAWRQATLERAVSGFVAEGNAAVQRSLHTAEKFLEDTVREMTDRSMN